MLERLRRGATYANVMATVAVFLALGGGAWAATALPRNSVGPVQLRADAVSSAKVADGSLRAVDFRRGELPRRARSLDGQLDLGTNGVIASIGGVELRAFCPLGGTAFVQAAADSGPGGSFYGWGTKTEDGALSAVDQVGGPGTTTLTATGVFRVSLGIVAAGTPAGASPRWLRIDISVIRGSRCNYHGLVIQTG